MTNHFPRYIFKNKTYPSLFYTVMLSFINVFFLDIPLKNETVVEAALEDGNIKVLVELSKVYPIPSCSISQNGKNVSL